MKLQHIIRKKQKAKSSIRMVEKTLNTLGTVAKVAVTGAYVAAMGYEFYKNWNSMVASPSDESEKSKN